MKHLIQFISFSLLLLFNINAFANAAIRENKHDNVAIWVNNHDDDIEVPYNYWWGYPPIKIKDKRSDTILYTIVNSPQLCVTREDYQGTIYKMGWFIYVHKGNNIKGAPYRKVCATKWTRLDPNVHAKLTIINGKTRLEAENPNTPDTADGLDWVKGTNSKTLAAIFYLYE